MARWCRPRPRFKILSSAPLRLRPFCLRSARRGSQAQGGEGWVSRARARARACVRAICPGQFELKKFKRLTRAGEPRGGGAGAWPRGCPVRGSDSRIRRFFARLGDFLRRIAAGARVSMGSRLGGNDTWWRRRCGAEGTGVPRELVTVGCLASSDPRRRAPLRQIAFTCDSTANCARNRNDRIAVLQPCCRVSLRLLVTVPSGVGVTATGEAQGQ